MNHRQRDGTVKRRFRWIGEPSRNYLALRAQLRNVEHKRIVRLRNHEHRLTTAIVKNHALIAIEDTQITNMTRSASGTLESPGTNVTQKRGLNRAILCQRWHSIRSQLAYKSQWWRRNFVPVPARNTSRTCLRCGFASPENRRTQSVFRCVSCSEPVYHPDVVAAENLRRQGIALAGAENPLSGPARANRRTLRGNKQSTGQSPLLLFVETRSFSFAIF